MKTYPQTPTGFFRILRNSFGGYGTVLKTTWYLILLFSLIVDLVPAFVGKLNHFVGLTVLLLMVLAGLFINAIILHMSNTAFSGNVPDFNESNKVAQGRYIRFLGGYVVLIVAVFVIGMIDFSIISLGNLTGMKILFGILAAIAVIFSLFILFLLYFALPLIILENRGVFKSFEISIKLVWGNWWRCFFVLFIVNFIVLLVGSLGVVTIKNVIAFGVWNFVWHFLSYPLIISTTLMLLRDLQLRRPELR